MPHSCQTATWECPKCACENRKYISLSTVKNCNNCKESVFWDGKQVVTYDEWLRRFNYVK